MLADEISIEHSLKLLQSEIGGEIRDGKLYPIAPLLEQLADTVRPEFADCPPCRKSYLLQAAPHWEDRVLASLQDVGFDAYLPKEPKSVRVNAIRRKTVQRPMLPGYLFPIFDEHRDRWELIPGIDGVIRLFMISMRPLPIPELAIQAIHDREEEAKFRGKGRPRAAIPFKIGSFVQIDDYGPWHGFMGRVTELLDRKQRIKLAIDVFGRQTPVEVSASQVRAV